MVLTMILTVILFVIGIALVVMNPLNALAITFGMFLVAVSILNVAIQVYFPSQPLSTVELRVVQPEKKAKKKPVKRVAKGKKSRKR